MPRLDSGYPADWFRIGERDLDRAKRLLADDDYPGAAFNLQQAVEKHLKGYLLARGWKLRRVHDIEVLLNEAARLDVSFEEFREHGRKMTQYYFEDRYPYIVASDLTREEIEASFAVAERIVGKTKSTS